MGGAPGRDVPGRAAAGLPDPPLADRLEPGPVGRRGRLDARVGDVRGELAGRRGARSVARARRPLGQALRAPPARALQPRPRWRAAPKRSAGSALGLQRGQQLLLRPVEERLLLLTADLHEREVAEARVDELL